MITPTATDIEAIQALLGQEIEVYQAFEGYLDQKRQIVVKGDLDALTRIDTEMEKLLHRSKQLEADRVEALRRLGREGQTLKEFIASLAWPEAATQLETQRIELLGLIKKVQELSMANQTLLSLSIKIIEQSVGYIASVLSPSGVSYADPNTSRPAAAENAEAGYGVSTTISREA